MVTREAYEDVIGLGVGIQHPTDPDRVAAIVEHVRKVGKWDLPPVLAIEDEDNGPTILDGHHRIEAAKALEHEETADGHWLLEDMMTGNGVHMEIPAYILSVADLYAIVEAHFGGETPNRLCDLDDYITISGTRYCDLPIRSGAPNDD